MDIKLEKKKGIQKKHIPYIIGGAALVVILGSIIFGNHASTLKVDARGLNIGEVKEEQFNDFVRVDGQVQPITVVQLSPEEGGIVRERVVEEGAQVKKGDVIIRLSNSNLDLQILNAEAELAEKSARLAELNSLLNMDEKGSEDALGVDEDAAETDVADRPRQPVNYAGRVDERTADNMRKPSVLAQLHAKQAERTAEPQKFQKRKSHDMEL